MVIIYDADGNRLGSLPLTEKQLEMLAGGGSIDVIYHTPQRLQGELGKRSGTFTLQLDGERLLTTTPAAVKDYEQLRAAVAAHKAREAS